MTGAPGPINTKRSDHPLNTPPCLGDNWRRIPGYEFPGTDGSPDDGVRGGDGLTPGVETRRPISFASGSVA